MTAPAGDGPRTDTAESFGDSIKAVIRGGLARHGRTQADMARDLGLSQKHVSQVLTGRVSGSLDTINAMLRYADPDHEGYGRPLPATPYGPRTDTAERLADPWRMAEWNALPDDQCGINGCDATETDPRGPVVMRDGSMHKVCTEHWEPIMRVLGEQATWESTDAMRSRR